MNTYILNTLILCFMLQFTVAQNKKETLLTVAGDPVSTDAFIKGFNKNIDLVTNEADKNVDGYLKLFTEYQLKLKEAKRLKLHESPKYVKEFEKYKNQLAEKYINDNEATEQLIKEAYNRSLLDIKAVHALVALKFDTNDTLAAYNKALNLRKQLLTQNFNLIKKNNHDGKTTFVENLGYFSAFKMVYDFETAAYNTPVNEVSMPFRTRFGYHVVKVLDKSPTPGNITLAHIMIAHKQADASINSEKRINEIYKRLQQGESFESLVLQFSDDKNTVNTNGAFSPFRRGQLNSESFETAAFNLANNGDYSQPIKTNYGWHIIKRLDLQPLGSYDELKPQLEQRVKGDSRSRLIDKAMIAKLKNTYNVSVNKDAKPYFKSIVTKDYFKEALAPNNFVANNTCFTIKNKTVTNADFLAHLKAVQKRYKRKSMPVDVLIDREFSMFLEKEIINFRKANLALENSEYADIIEDYRDGLLLFDLMEQEVWNKASKDTSALKSYFNTNKNTYMWPQRIELLMASSAKQVYVQQAQLMFKNGETQSAIEKLVNANNQANVMFTSGVFAPDDYRLPKNLKVKPGISKIYNHNNGFQVLHIKNIVQPTPKTFIEAKGIVVSDYQKQVEKDWLDNLKQRYPVTVNEKALKRLKQQLKKR